jgi:hypothetical protein
MLGRRQTLHSGPISAARNAMAQILEITLTACSLDQIHTKMGEMSCPLEGEGTLDGSSASPNSLRADCIEMSALSR